MSFDEAIQTFGAESRALLAEMEQALLRLELRADDAEAIHAVFRAAHTIKGSAGLFGFDAIVGFTHHLESLLVRMRDGKAVATPGMTDLLLACADHIGRLLAAQLDGRVLTPADTAAGAGLLQRLGAAQGETPAGGALTTGQAPLMRQASRDADAIDNVWHLSLRVSPGVLRDGLDPAAFIRHLRTLGRIVHIATLADALPPLPVLDAHDCHLGFEIRLASDADKAEIEAVFDFMRDDCRLHILPPDSRIGDFLQLIESLPEDRLRLGELLVASGAVTQRELDAAMAEQAGREPAHVPLGQILLADQVVQPELVHAALTKQAEARQRQAQESRLIRVQADKLDALIDLVGEMVAAGASVGLLSRRHGDRQLSEAVSLLARLTESVRDGAMRLRMVEIGETFNRFRRIVRDVAKELGKPIDFAVSGAETELDKSVVERLADPLTHLVRNAIDHGIEPRPLREARGKPARGRLELAARHESGGIVIEVRDDGGGLDRTRILAKARKRGLVAPDAQPTDAQVDALIFEPGFSTAEQVSDLSGRGVGMDVVRTAITALRGSVEIDSTPGAGAVFRLRLPLTLAIVDGFLLSVGDGHFVVPLDMVLECVELPAEAIGSGACDVLDLRGEVLPLLRLRERFHIDAPPTRRENVVVMRLGTRKLGLVIDRLLGQFQAVIKPLAPLLRGLPGIAGSTVLASGGVALVLDVAALLDTAPARRLHSLRSDPDPFLTVFMENDECSTT